MFSVDIVALESGRGSDSTAGSEKLDGAASGPVLLVSGLVLLVSAPVLLGVVEDHCPAARMAPSTTNRRTTPHRSNSHLRAVTLLASAMLASRSSSNMLANAGSPS